MTTHIFGAFLTAHGTAANNRGLTEGNTVTLQKLVWEGQVHTAVSAESIRFALRRRLELAEPCNRTYDDGTRSNEWKDPAFSGWQGKANGKRYIDDDLLGFMAAEGAKEENSKGGAKVRRAVLELTRAVSLTPWSGDVTFNAASPGATPSAQKKGAQNPVPYATELHATRYQYGMAMTPSRLFDPARAQVALRHLCALGEVAGNHGRFLYDFSPESAIFRVTAEPAPRILYAFRQDGREVGIGDVVRKVRAGDIKPDELIVGGAIVDALGDDERQALAGAKLYEGVMAACAAACERIKPAKS
jgi:CRISPR-associated protein Cst2